MKNIEFRTLLHIVSVADEQSEVWWAGYLFMNLTTAQVRRLMEYLEVRPFIKHVKTITNKDALMMPSGICIEYK